MLAGELYNICCCMTFPINILVINEIVLKLSRQSKFIEANLYEVNPLEFNYSCAFENKYRDINIKNNFNEYILNNSLVNLDLIFDNGIEARLYMEYYDENFYSVNLLLYNEQIDNNYDKESIYKFINEIEIFLYNTLNPIYATKGIEKGVFSINELTNKDYEMFYNDIYISKDVYNLVSDKDKKLIESKTNHVLLDNKGIYIKEILEDKDNMAKLILKSVRNCGVRL